MPTTPRQVTSPSPILQELIALGVVRMAADGKTPIVGNGAAPLVGYEEDPLTGGVIVSMAGSPTDLSASRTSPRTGLIATRCLSPQATDTSKRQAMFRRRHIMKSPVNTFKVIFPGMFIQGGSLAGYVGANTTIRASVEYPAGVITQMTFGGSSTGTITDATLITSDDISVSIPKNAAFWVRVWISNSVGILYTGSQLGFAAVGDGAVFSATTTPDLTGGGAVSFTSAYTYGAVAIIGVTRDPSVLILADSIGKGQGGSGDFMGHQGSIERSVGQRFATCNLGSPGAKAQDIAGFNVGYAFWSLFQYFDTVVIGLGSNDIFLGSRTSAQVITDLTTIAGFFPISRVFSVTVLPRPASSSDSWATSGGQTLAGTEAQRTALNNALRAYTVSGISGVWDISAAVETTYNSGLWLSPGMTVDGVHGTDGAYEAIHYSGRISLDAIDA